MKKNDFFAVVIVNLRVFSVRSLFDGRWRRGTHVQTPSVSHDHM